MKRGTGGIKRKKRATARLKRSKAIPKSLLRKADDAFSLVIRGRDRHCQYPGCESVTTLQCSHYIGRATKSTRFDPDNCIALCWFHHFKSKDLGYEYQKQTQEKHGYDGRYTLYMKQLLGPKRFEELMQRSQESFKLTREFLEAKIAELS